MRIIPRPTRRARTGSSVLALATVLVVGASPASAQSFQASGSFFSNGGPGASITIAPNTTNIAVNPGQTVIDWSPSDTGSGGGAINFQPAGTTANFVGSGNYAVLNRINPADSTRAIGLNGTINTLALGAAAAANGSLYFYTPGGFVIGNGAIINVGSLVLSASPLALDASNNFIGGVGTTNTVTFGQATQAGASIVTNTTSQINASGTDAYVAMVAPRVQHGGTINVAGSAALVGAEAATISFSPDGLFDIQVTTGTTDIEGVEVTGTITGSAGGPGDHHRAYLVAVPKNSLLTMAIGSGANLGFAVADFADVVGNTVVLSAGHDISNGAISFASAGSTGPGAIANLDVRDTVFTSAMIGEATGTALLSGFGMLKFHSDVTVHADGEIQLSTQLPTGLVDIDGALSLSTEQSGFAGANVTSARVQIVNINGGDINVDGLTTINTDAFGGSSGIAGVNGGNATAGSVNINSNPGGSISLLGGLNVTAEGRGGGIFVPGIDAGSGTGGQVVVRSAGNDSALTITGGTSIEARGYGGSGAGGECFSCDGDGGAGQGGDIRIIGQSGTGATVTLTGPVSAIADGIGGTAGTGAIAGTGTGGNADYFVGTGSAMSLTGNLLLQANGTGGLGITSAGGAGIGGRVSIAEQAGSTGGTITITGNVVLGADGTGGNSFGSGASGGTGTGGGGSQGAYIFADAAAITINGQATLHSTGTGGSGFNGIGGDGTGGYARLRSNSALTVTGNATVSANATGGVGANGGGDAIGGDAYAFSTGAMTLGGLTASANATGGNVLPVDGGGWSAGNATGGDVDVYADDGTLTIVGATILSSDGTGGLSSQSTDFSGNGTGGTTRLFANAGGMVSLQSLTATAIGSGGGSPEFLFGIGGDGQGGTVRVEGTAVTASVMVGGAATLDASGKGSSNIGGDGTGGTAEFFAASGSSLTVGGFAQAKADGVGGSYVGTAGNGGIGDGGVAAVYSAGGNITFNNDVALSAAATGGSTSNGLGGNALGGIARLGTDGGDILVTGTLGINGSATGGAGTSGGNATSLISPSTDETLPVAVSIYAGNGGSVTVGGQATLNGSATGGAGFNGAGGNAVGGEADIVAFVGDIDLGSLALDVSARGGNAGGGGNGGSGQGGAADVTLGLNAAPIDGTITIGSATINANGVGGNGGTGLGDFDGGINGNGGNGGAGLGGSILLTGSAAGGTLDINGAAILTALGNGGRGGNGAGGETGIGGSGGTGGAGTGGVIQTGTISNSNSPGSGGGAAYTTLSIDTSATGGNGGNGGVAGGGTGAGGDGGNAIGGRSQFLARGVPVTADAVTLAANATGGNGGTGSVAGDGGNARTGFINVESKDRFDTPTQRGSLTVDSIIGTAAAIGGSGATTGSSTVADGSYFRVLNGDATIGSVAITLLGGSIDSTLGPSFVSVRDGTATIGEFSFLTDGTLSLDANNGSMIAGSIALHAANFVPHVADPAPTAVGTFFAQSFDIQTGNNFVTTAHLDSVQTLSIVAPGAIQIGNVTGDANIILNAQGAEVDIGNVLAGGGIDIDADDFIFTGNLTGSGVIDLNAGSSIQAGSILNTGNTSLFAGSSINVGAINSGNGAVSLITNSASIFGDVVVGGSIYADSGSDLFLGNLTAPGDIELYAVSDMMIGNATAGETIDLEAGGYVDGDTMTAGDSVYVEAGDYVDLLNISAGIVDPSFTEGAEYNVGILSGGTIDTGDIAAANSIGLGAVDDIYTGSIDAGNIFLALGGGDMSFGEINSGGTTYLADDGMIALGGDPSEGDFDPALILATTPVVSGGSITLRGPVTAGRFVAAASGAISGSTIDSDTSIYTANGGNVTLTDLDAGTSIFQRSNGIITENDLTAGTFIDIQSTGGLALGDLVAGDYIDLRSTAAIGLGNATSGETINFLSGSTLTGANLTAGNAVLAETMGAIQLGNVTAGITDPSVVPGAQYAARFSSGGAITIGNVNALGRIGFGTPTTLQTGDLTSGDGLMALVGGNMSLGTINADDHVYLASYSMSALGGSFATFNRAPILASTPVATGGSITLRGPVTAGNFTAAAGTFVDGGNISVDTGIFITAGTNITLDNLVAGSIGAGDDAILFDAGGLINFDNATAIGGIDLEAVGSITGDDLTSGQSIHAEAGGAIEFESLSAGLINPQANDPDDDVAIGIRSLTSIGVGSVNSAESVGFVSLGSLDTGPITTGGDVIALAGGYIELGTINAGGRVFLANASIYEALDDAGGDDDVTAEQVLNSALVPTGGSILTGPITAGQLQAAAGTTMWIDGDIDSDTSVDLSSGGAMQLEHVTAGSTIRLTSGATIDGGDLTAGSDVRVFAAGAVDVGDITIESGIVVVDGFTTQDVGPGTPVEVFGASITTGNISTDGYVGLYTPGDLEVGTIDAGHDVIALVGDDANFGAITTPERFFLGGYEMYALVTGGEGFNPEAVFDAATKSSTDGSATFAGSSSAGSFEAYVGDDTTLASLSTDFFALIDTGGLFTLTGTFNGGTVVSNDIDIGANALVTGDVTLVSRNSTGTLIGDGLTGNGYRLSDAEVDRIRAGFRVGADVGRGADDLMLIGDLSITRNANDPGDEYGFLVGNEATGTELGTIRIVGDVTFNNLLNGELVYFTSQTFELDAATGSISLFGQGTTLGGRLSIESDQVWVASETILAKLRANPLYAGRVAELNAPAAVQRPEGVIRAEAIEFGEDEAPSSLLVQNTGTTATPAGFLLNAASIGSDDEGGEIPPGSIDLVINGQVITESGTATGIAVRDGLVAEFGTTAFVAGSTINGCQLVGACITPTNPRPPVVETVKPTDVQLTDGSGLGDGLFGNEPDIDDGESGDEGDMSSPIVAPVPLFDSRPLTASGDIDDPVSGAGNPSLYGNPSDDEAAQCDSSKDASCKTGKKGDGK